MERVRAPVHKVSQDGFGRRVHQIHGTYLFHVKEYTAERRKSEKSESVRGTCSEYVAHATFVAPFHGARQEYSCN